jgi:hypothetical protein
VKQLQTIFSEPFKAANIDDMIAAALEKHEQQIIDYNTQQLDRGLDAKGKSLGKYKNFKYKNRFQPVDLKLTGSYRNKKTLTPGKKKAEMFSQDEKAPMLEKRYGKDIEGLSAQNMDNVSELIKPHVQRLFLLSMAK